MTPTVDLDKVCRLLTELGNTPDEVAQLLTAMNIKGSHCTKDCPIFRYLDKKLPEAQGDINVSGTCIHVNGFMLMRPTASDQAVQDMQITSRKKVSRAPTAVVFAFVRQFDGGRYPQLDDD